MIFNIHLLISGVISWEEYHSHFLKTNGVDEEIVKNPNRNSSLDKKIISRYGNVYRK